MLAALDAIPIPNLGGLSLLGNPWLDLALLLGAGVMAGIVNAMAGGGSFLAIPILIGLGVPPSTANGTIRVAILLQNATLVGAFHKNGVHAHKLSLRLAPPIMAGALLGSWLATRLDDELFRPLLGIILLLWAVILVIKPDRFLHPPDQERSPKPMTYALALAVGLYGGFLQSGVGFPLLALLSGHLGYDLVRANSVKASLIFAYTCLALPVFAFAGQVAWTPAFVLAAGTMGGAWLGVRWQLEKGASLVRWFVLVMVTVAGVLMLYSAFA
ncbi:hypothetical protein ENSA5_64990 [Enhygromyxa salina]|uniref:Probable membrane transporter protein n=1 Tax=Enhygromyxa salina TaxID=215803 RepID=A0A2S9XCF2_9BACT|nr:sulfite exporter TauE/SafE family protein [Enhygromyxa salina]PRP90480.1 hypothetical protein ENSA5_64990 [Enhygromyxa salina]